MNFGNILKDIKNIDRNIIKIMKNGVRFSFIFCIFASFLLATYCANCNPDTYIIGISLFKSGLFFFSAFVICGLAFNRIMKEIL